MPWVSASGVDLVYIHFKMLTVIYFLIMCLDFPMKIGFNNSGALLYNDFHRQLQVMSHRIHDGAPFAKQIDSNTDADATQSVAVEPTTISANILSYVYVHRLANTHESRNKHTQRHRQ